MPDAFTISQTQRTNPDPYDQIFVLSQKTINDELNNMWAVASDDSPLLSFHLTIHHAQSLDCQLKAPVVSLQVTDGQNPQLYYYLQMQSGTLKLYISDNSDDLKPFDVTDWSIAIPVKISRKMVHKGDDAYKYYEDITGFENNVFSIAQLYIDASTSAIWSPERSSFNGLDWSKETKSIQTNFGFFMSQWMSNAAANQTNIIGAQILADPSDTVNSHAPSFVPTSIDYYNYAWHDPNYDPDGTGPIANGIDENALCYLTVSDFANPPEPAGLSFTGTFVDDNAVFCMNRSLFWDKWLLPLLQEINQALEFTPPQSYLATYQGSGGWDVTCAPEFAFGQNRDHPSKDDSYFAFYNYQWQGDEQKSDIAYATGVHTGDNYRAWSTATSSSGISFDTGGQKIHVAGSSTFFFRIEDMTSGPYSTMTINTDWHLDLALGAVNDGGLEITRYDDGTQAATSTYSSHDGGMVWETDFDGWTKSINDSIASYMDSYISAVSNDLSDALSNQHKLFLPGSGIFLAQDAKFNARGDLLATLNYNGAPSPIQRQQNNISEAKMARYKDHYKLPADVATERLDLVPPEWANLPKRRPHVLGPRTQVKPKKPTLPAFHIKLSR